MCIYDFIRQHNGKNIIVIVIVVLLLLLLYCYYCYCCYNNNNRHKITDTKTEAFYLLAHSPKVPNS